MVIAHNMLSMYSERQLGITKTDKEKSSEKLSSGYRINRSADDAAGLAISEKMRGQVRGLMRGAANTQDAISLTQTADGVLDQGTAMVQRIRELAVQAANGIYTDEDRKAIDEEVQQLKREMDRIFDEAEFNKKKIFVPGDEVLTSVVEATVAVAQVVAGSTLPPGVQILGDSANSQHMTDTYMEGNVTYNAASWIDFSNCDLSNKDAWRDTGFYCTCCTCDAHYCISFNPDRLRSESIETGTTHHTYTIGIKDCSNAADVLQAILAATTENPHDHFTKMKENPSGSNKLLIYDERPNQTASGNYGILRAGVIKEEMATGTISLSSSSEGGYSKEWVQTGANDDEGFYIYKRGMTNTCLGITTTNTLTEASASAAISAMDRALNYINKERARWGAYQNRLEYTYNYDTIAYENQQDAESRIRDTDMAEEMTKLAKHNILEQAGVSVLSHANQDGELVLSLLQ